MKALRTFTKKLLSFRKIVWLFLCGMLIIAEEAGAQKGDLGTHNRPVEVGHQSQNRSLSMGHRLH